LGCIAFAAFVTSPFLQAQTRAHALKVCNEGNVDVRIATVRHEEGAFFSDTYVAKGWFAVPRGECSIVFDEPDSDGVWLAVTFVDAYGAWRAAPIYPEKASFFGKWTFNVTSSERKFCVLDGRFEWEEDSANKLARCPANSEGHEIPFTVWFGHPSEPGGTTFTIRPDLHAPAWTIHEPPRATRVPAPRASPSPSPTVRAPQRPPKPLEAGTMNAAFRGQPAVRWLSDGRWYWYSRPGAAQPTLLASDPAVPSLGGLLNRHRFDLPEQYPQDGFEQRPSVRRPLDRLASAGGARPTLSSGGRLTAIFPANGNRSGNVLSANLYALDLERADFVMSGSGVRMLTVRCKLRDCVFLTAGDSVIGSVDTWNIPTTEANIDVLKGALRELLALFKPTDYTIENDVQCSCSRVVDRVVTK
jgi:uncharacterized membrane protein